MLSISFYKQKVLLLLVKTKIGKNRIFQLILVLLTKLNIILTQIFSNLLQIKKVR